jgi:choline dehydrogenase
MALYIYYSLLLHLLPLAGSTTCNPGAENSFGRPNQNETYDYVVIGGGTAGLAVAMRLVETTSCAVAVVEAGGF